MERLSGMDAFFLYLESSTQQMHVTLCAVLDPSEMPGGYSYARLREHVASRVHRIPPFTRTLVTVPLNVHHPLWAEDASFDLDNHVRRAALPAPGSQQQLATLTARLAESPLDRSKPLWELWVIEGLSDGHVALVAKVHHSALDGVAGVEQLVTLFDLERSPTPEDGAPTGSTTTTATTTATAPEPEAGSTPAPSPAAPAPRGGEEVPGDLELVAYATVARALSITEVLPLVGRTVGAVWAVRRTRTEIRRPNPYAEERLDPAAAAEDPDPATEATGATPLTAPGSPLNGAITGDRRVAFARVSLDEIKQARSGAPGATINDVILAICAGGLRRFLLRRDELPAAPLVAACPVNVRAAHEQGRADNRISALFTDLPTHVADPVDRLVATQKAAAAAKREHAIFSPDTLQRWAEVMDPNVASWLSDLYVGFGLTERHPPAMNVMISNVPGPPFPLYLAGAELVRAYPMGQIIEGVGLNITVMSYRDGVDFGLMAAANLLPDITQLAADLEADFAELVAATAPPSAGVTRATRSRSNPRSASAP
jgi:diacylglycerol O-acyltransferase